MPLDSETLISQLKEKDQEIALLDQEIRDLQDKIKQQVIEILNLNQEQKIKITKKLIREKIKELEPKFGLREKKLKLSVLKRQRSSIENKIKFCVAAEKLIHTSKEAQKQNFQNCSFKNYYQPINPIKDGKQEGPITDKNRWLKFMKEQKDSKFKRLQLTFTDPEDYLISQKVSPEILNGAALSWPVLNPEKIPDHLVEHLKPGSLKKKTPLEKLQIKIDLISEIKAFFKKAEPLHFEHEKPDGTKKQENFYRVLVIKEPKRLENRLLIFTNRAEAKNFSPKIILFKDIYSALRSQEHADQAYQSSFYEEGESEENKIRALIIETKRIKQIVIGTKDQLTEEEKGELQTEITHLFYKLNYAINPTKQKAHEQAQKATQAQDSLNRPRTYMQLAWILFGIVYNLEKRLGETTAISHRLNLQNGILQKMIYDHEKTLTDFHKAYAPLAAQKNVSKISTVFSQFEAELAHITFKPFDTYRDKITQKINLIRSSQRKITTPEINQKFAQQILELYLISKFWMVQKKMEHLLHQMKLNPKFPTLASSETQKLREFIENYDPAETGQPRRVLPEVQSSLKYQQLFETIKLWLKEIFANLEQIKTKKDSEFLAEKIKGWNLSKLIKELP
ncbi:hypothetical protein COT40_00640 [Candidatus Peregrinibacteria bacterium CG08_land_8_20_14_0_20_41_10]|nr:MAG: hypothetical protein COT40_00640 [Candidatus Peregrinibacteria bacterium CG08_land_8_20_14_0_20_41_10]